MTVAVHVAYPRLRRPPHFAGAAEFGVPIGGGSTLQCATCVDAAQDVPRSDCVTLNGAV